MLLNSLSTRGVHSIVASKYTHVECIILVTRLDLSSLDPAMWIWFLTSKISFENFLLSIFTC